MKNLKPLIIALSVSVVSGCATSPMNIIKESQSDHPHLNQNVKNAGEYHVRNFMNQRAGKIGVQILDRFEEPDYIDVPQIKAEIIHSDGSRDIVWLRGEGYKAGLWDEPGHGASIFSVSRDWIKAIHSVTLRIWIPLPDGNTYELEFECSAKKPLSKHSGL